MKTDSRKVILYIAASLDGYIAKEDGSIDWLIEADSRGEGDNGYASFLKRIDTVVWGKKTYDQVLGFEEEEFSMPDMTHYVFSRSVTDRDEHAEFINEDVSSFMKKLKARPGKDIWLMGGAELADAFLKEQLVDEFIITIIPVLLGSGIPLFKAGIPEQNLRLKETVRYGEFVQMHHERTD